MPLILLLILALFAADLHAEADLSSGVLTYLGSPFPAAPDISMTLRFRNNGPLAVADAIATIELTEGLDARAVPSYCTNARPIRCTLPRIEPDAEEQPTIVLAAPLRDVEHTMTVRVQSLTVFDPNLSNNTFTATLRFLDDPFIEIFFPFENVHYAVRVDPGQTFERDFVVENDSPGIPARDVLVRFVATSAAIAGVTLPGFTCTIDGNVAECRTPELRTVASVGGRLTLRFADDRRGGAAEVRATISASNGAFDPTRTTHTLRATINRIVSVTTTADSGAGSLRAAIDEANVVCHEGNPCKVIFEIAEPVPSSGWFTIEPRTPLPAVTARRVTLDGRTQTTTSGNTNPNGPVIFLDGRHLGRGDGLVVTNGCHGEVRGFVIGNFPQYGIVMRPGLGCTDRDPFDQHFISQNYLGTDPTGTAARPNMRGIDITGGIVFQNLISGNTRSGVWIETGGATVLDNRIGTTRNERAPLPNGASGVLVGPSANAEVRSNAIQFNAHMGVAAATRHIDVRQNRMKDNGGIGIDIGLDGPNGVRPSDEGLPTNPPILLSAVYRNGKTFVSLRLQTTPLGPFFNNYVIDMYANDGPDGDGERWIGTLAVLRPEDATEFDISEDLTGKWLNATSTRVHFAAAKSPVAGNSYAGGETKTSELSAAVLVTRE